MANLAHKASRTRISVRKEFIEQNRLRLGFERKLRLQMQTLFAETGQQAQREYTEAGRLIFSGRDIQQNLQKVLNSHYRAVIDAFGLRVLRNQKADGQFETLVRDYIRSYGAQRVTQISNTTMAQIRRVIDAGDAEGLGNAVIGRNIFDSMRGSFSKYRSATIARTETHSAASYANHEVNASLNIPNQKKRWVSVADLRSRPSHAAANGTEVELDEDFIIGGVAMGYTGDPKGGVANVVNCRCVTLYVSPEDEVFVDDKPPSQEVRGQLDIGDRLTVKSPKIRQQYNEKLNDNLSGLALSAALRLPKPATIVKSKNGFYEKKRTLISSDLEGNTLEHEYGHHVDFVARNPEGPFGLKVTSFLSEQDKGFQRAFIDDAKALGLAVDGKDVDDMLGFDLSTGVNPVLEKLRGQILKQVDRTKTYTRGRNKGLSFQYKGWDPAFDGANSISDILDAMSKGVFYSDFSAWGHGRKYYKRSGSPYYETFANLYAIHGNAQALDEARKLFPNTVREFERMLKELADG